MGCHPKCGSGSHGCELERLRPVFQAGVLHILIDTEYGVTDERCLWPEGKTARIVARWWAPVLFTSRRFGTSRHELGRVSKSMWCHSSECDLERHCVGFLVQGVRQ